MNIFRKGALFYREAVKAREARLAKLQAIRNRAEADYQEFLDESSETAPRAPKNPEASLFRHAWRRAEALKHIYSHIDGPEKNALIERYAEFAERASQDYAPVAPSNLYGKIYLKMPSKQGNALAAKELERIQSQINPKLSNATRNITGCIYKGVCGKTGRIYIGQTVGAPEQRWAQHRRDQTGPFKKGAINPSYEILEIPVKNKMLDQREAYFIGYYDSYENGLNETSGNDRGAYERGCEKRDS